MTISRIKGIGWTPGNTLKATEMTQVDINLVKCIDKTSVDLVPGVVTWADGGALEIDVDGYFYIMEGSTAEVGNAASLNVKDNGSLVVESNGTIDMQIGSALNGAGDITITNDGSLTFSGSNDWPQLASRTVIKSMPAQLVGHSFEGGGSLITDAVAYPSTSTDGPGVTSKTLIDAGEWLRLALPLGPKNSTLESVSIWSKGDGTTTGLNLATYRVQSLNISGSSIGAVTNVSATTTDAHASDGSDWEDWVETEITVSSPLFSPDTRVYWIYVVAPYSASGVKMDYLNVTANYTVTELRY